MHPNSTDQSFAEFLISTQSMSSSEICHALERSKVSNESLFRILLTNNFLHEVDAGTLLAQFLGIEFRLLRHTNLANVELAEGPSYYLSLGCFPLFEDRDVHVIGTSELTRDQVAWATRTYGKKHRFILFTYKDLCEAIRARFDGVLNELAIEQLFRESPLNSAKFVLTRHQRVYVFLFLALLIVLASWDWKSLVTALFVGSNLFYGLTAVFRVVLTAVGIVDPIETSIERKEVVELAPRLPRYSVVVAMYKEAEVLPVLVHYLRQLDYPREKLQIILAFEKDDVETLESAKQLSLENIFEFLIVPSSYPKTKPKALNYALPFVRGEYVTIYDAEDRPESDQLKKVVAAFKNLPSSVGCIQARLNFFNQAENFLTRMFTLEYSLWFDYLLPGLYKMGMPIPLGGTSNHFKTVILRELCGWDPYNVTEDADLGIRLEKYHYSVATLNSTTYEEANSELGNWIRQRSRWIKGHLQTWIVHMRGSTQLVKDVGPLGVVGFNLFLGGPVFMVLLNPILIALGVCWLLFPKQPLFIQMPDWVASLGLFNLVAGNLTYILLGLVAAFKRRYFSLIPWVLLLPLYWVLHSVAGLKAVYQLFVSPHFWEKTKHGISRVGVEERQSILRSLKYLRPKLKKSLQNGESKPTDDLPTEKKVG